MTRYKGAEILVEYLLREQVPYVFGTCGHGNLGLLDALYDRQDDIRTISVHHESVAGFMADAYYRVTHRPAATFTSTGPGSSNLPVALGSALMDSSALFAVTGNVPTSQFNRAPFQELGRHHQADLPSALRPFVKRSFQATRPEQLPLMVRQAFSTMLTGRPGPVLLDVPLNVFVETADVEVPDPSRWRRGVAGRPPAPAEAIARAADLLLGAERPVVVAGHGVELADATAELSALAELLDVPVAHSPLGKGVFPATAPQHVGATGRNGTYAANRATREADVVLAVGTRFDDRSTSSWLPGYTYAIPPTRLVHIDIDAQELGRNYPPTIGIAADAKAALRQLHDALLPGREFGRAARLRWLEQVERWGKEWDEHVAAHRGSDAVPIRPERLLADLRRVLPDDGIVVCDVGVHHNWLVQEWPAYEPRTVLQSWGFASMGFGVAGVLGAKLGAPGRHAVALVGDGGFLQLPSAVATAVQYDIPAVWVVWNNRGFCSIRDQQVGYFGAGRELATNFEIQATGELYTADYAAMGKSMGAEGARVERPGDLAPLIETAINSGRPYVLDVHVDRDAQSPAVASWDLPPLPHPEPTFGWGSG